MTSVQQPPYTTRDTIHDKDTNVSHVSTSPTTPAGTHVPATTISKPASRFNMETPLMSKRVVNSLFLVAFLSILFALSSWHNSHKASTDLMSNKHNLRSQHREPLFDRDDQHDLDEKLAARAREMSEKAKDAGERAKSSAKDTYDDLAYKAKVRYEQAKDTITDVKDDVVNKIDTARVETKNLAGRIKEGVEDKLEDWKDAAYEKYHDLKNKYESIKDRAQDTMECIKDANGMCVRSDAERERDRIRERERERDRNRDSDDSRYRKRNYDKNDF